MVELAIALESCCSFRLRSFLEEDRLTTQVTFACTDECIQLHVHIRYASRTDGNIDSQQTRDTALENHTN